MENLKNKTILIVEDESIVAIDLQERLRQMGYNVPAIFDNGNDLLAYAAQYAPDLVIMDIMIKGDLDGIQTAQKLSLLLDIPVLFLTAYSDETTFQRAKLSDAYAFLIKPFNQREVETTIEIAFFRHHILKKVSNERKKFWHILKNLRDAIVITNENGEVDFYNESAVTFFQLPAFPDSTFIPIEEMLPFLKTIPENPNLIQDILKGKVREYKLDNVKLEVSNKSLVLDLLLFPFSVEGSEARGLVFIAHDVSEKIKFLEEIQQSERQYRSLFEKNLAGVAQEKLDGTILRCNDAFAKIFGYTTREELLHQNSSQFYQSPLEREALVQLLLDTGYLTNVELFLKRKDNTSIWTLQNMNLTTSVNNEKIIEITVMDITHQKNIENELKKSQANLLTLIENTNSIIWSINRNYELISFNHQYAERFYAIFSFYPRPYYDTKQLGEEHIRYWKDYYELAFKGEKFSKELHYKHKGKTYYLEVHFHPVYTSQEQPEIITLYANDITEKKLQQIEKQKYLDLLDAVFKQSNDGLAIADYQGQILQCNQKFLDILGFTTIEELIIQNQKEIIIPKNVLIPILKRVFQYQSWQGEIFYEHKGKEAWLDVSFQPIKVLEETLLLIRVTDITDKIKAEEMRLLLHTAISNISDGILILDNQAPPIVIYANEAYFNITKQNQKDMLSKPFVNIQKVLNRIPQNIIQKMEAKQNVKFEFQNIREDGSSYLCEIEFYPVHYDQKTFYLIILRDITERKKQERELMEARINQQKLISKAVTDTQEMERKRFAEDLHDSLGQILSAIKINLNALESVCHNHENSELYRKTGRLLDDAIQEVRSISHQLMPSSLEQLGLNAALKELCQNMNKPHQIEISYQSYGQEKKLNKTHEITLYRVVQELLNNSFKHSKANNVYIQLFYYENALLLMYEDDGKGFNLPQTLNQSKGIGLKNIQHRIELIQGSISFETEEGKGFLCTIEIPLAE